MTVLEAVVRQTGVYASSRKGRLSVYWGDQVFIPSAPFKYTPTHHVDIMCTLLGDTAPTAEEWVAQGLDKYGVIAVLQGDEKNAAQVEKIDHATAVKMLASLGKIGQVGPSLGSFSVSSEFLTALCKEYSTELAEKVAKLDTDPHFWMPLTLPEVEYISLMEQKGIEADVSEKHHQRMAIFKATLDLSQMGIFGAVNVGSNACWWDYGLVKLYSKNNLKLLGTDSESDLLRQFMGITDNVMESELGSTDVDESSRVFGCTIKEGGFIKGSAMAGVTAKIVEAEGAIIVNCVAPKIVAGKGSILYNLISDEEIIAEAGAIIVEVMEESGDKYILKSDMNTCGGNAWKVKLPMNDFSFEQVHGKNQDANITVIEGKRQELYKKVAASL